MATVPNSSLSNENTVQRRQTATAVISSILGWSLDLFDLFILLYVAPVIANLFFPVKSPTLSLAYVYASFAVTLLMRPAGSAIFGAYADKHGRKKAMLISVIGVGIVTALLGTLPTYQKVGILGPVLFLLVRLVQGVFVGGVVASTHTIGTETVAPKWRGLMSGLIGGGGASVGALVASIVFTIVSSAFPGDAFAIWGWRVMFFSGIISAILGVFVFRKLEESPLWLQAKREGEKNKEVKQKTPLKTLFSGKYLPIMLMNLIVVIGGGTSDFFTSGYLPTFLGVINKLPKPVSGQIMIWASLVVIIATVLVGHLSEFIGRKKTFILMGAVNLIVIPFAYTKLATATAYNDIVLFVLILAFFGNAAYAPILIFLNERFPTAIRASGTGLSWNLGFAVGGMMPTFVTLASPSVKDIPSRLVVFMLIATALLLIGGLLTPETKGKFE